jgi:hypothetical protein
MEITIGKLHSFAVRLGKRKYFLILGGILWLRASETPLLKIHLWKIRIIRRNILLTATGKL